MAKSVAIPALANSAYAMVDDDNLRAAIDQISGDAKRAADWSTRQKVLLDTIAALDSASEVMLEAPDAANANGAGAAAEDIDEDAIDPDQLFAETLPMYMAAILERLGERSISSAAQAAFYMISAHPEHQDAAQDWIGLDESNTRAFEDFVQANEYYQDVLDRMIALEPGEDEA